jgi:integrase
VAAPYAADRVGRVRVAITDAQAAVVGFRFLDNDDPADIALDGAAMTYPPERGAYIAETLEFYADQLRRNPGPGLDGHAERRSTEALARKVRLAGMRANAAAASSPAAPTATDDQVADVVPGPPASDAETAVLAPSASAWGMDDVVLVADKWSPDGAPAHALVMAEDPDRPTVVKVKYLHSRTAAWVARARVLGPAPVAPTVADDQLLDDVDAVRDPRDGELIDVTKPAPAARTADATPALPSPPAAEHDDQVADDVGDAGDGLALVPVTSPPGELVSVQARERIEHYAAAATAPNTARAYRHDWEEFSSWCAERMYSALPASPAVIAAHAVELADRPVISVATIERRLAAIGRMHREAGFDPPPNRALEVQKVMTGIRRTLGVAPRRQRTPLSPDELRRLLASVDPQTLAGERDRALLLVGYYFAGRRSELVALDVEDLVEVADGLRIMVRRSKTDQEGEGEVKGVPRKPDPAVCPVVALQGWMDAAGIAEGPIWRRVTRWDTPGGDRLSPQSVNLIIKRACRRAGIDDARYAGHSLRSGFATAAGAAKAPERAIMRQTGHRSERMVRKYIRPASVFHENAGAWVNL